MGGLDVDGIDFIALLLHDVVVRRASSETLCDQKLVQVGQRGYTHARSPEFHPGAGPRVQHPPGDLDDHPWRGLDPGDKAARAMFYGLKPYWSPVQGMPAILNSALLPDMGRMNG